jgi:hypothetical protein
MISLIALDLIVPPQLSSLVAQFPNRTRERPDASMRRELQNTAPHVFRQPAKALPTKAPRAETRKPASPARAAQKAVVNGAPASDEAGDWEEF